MKVFSVTGVSDSGKTTTIENIIAELRKRKHSVGSVKEIHHKGFSMDREGTNTYRHKMAGSQLVTARGLDETDILFGERLPINDILRFYNHDYVVLEGVTDCSVPRIITAITPDEVDERLDGSVFAISGRIAGNMTEYKGIPVIDSTREIEKLVSLIEEKVFDMLPDFPAECCSACGYSCREMTARILQGKSKRGDCVISQSSVKLYVDGREIAIVPFVQRILKNAVEAVVKELDGYREGAPVKIEIGGC